MPPIRFAGLVLVAGLTVAAACSTEADTAADRRVEVEQAAAPAVPDVCLEALDHADAGFAIGSEFAGSAAGIADAAARGFQAVAELDIDAASAIVDEVEAINAQIADQTARLEQVAPAYAAARDACREAAK